MDARELVPSGLPVDSSGFPLTLASVRDEVIRRNGKFVPDGYRWLAYHNDVTLPRLYLYFHSKGSIELAVSQHEIGFYARDKNEESQLEFETDFINVLNGGYREYVLIDDRGVFKGSGFDLAPPPLNEPPTLSQQTTLRVVWWSYDPGSISG